MHHRDINYLTRPVLWTQAYAGKCSDVALSQAKTDFINVKETNRLNIDQVSVHPQIDIHETCTHQEILRTSCSLQSPT